jgi:hypothetical protein
LSFRRNRTFVVAWLIPLLVALAALALPATGEAAEAGAIAGTVTAEGGGPLAGVEVCAEEVEEGEEGFACAKTDGSGNYQLIGLPAGEYKVFFGPPKTVNYVWQYYGGVRSWELATPVTVVGGATKSGVDAVLEKGATMSGVVTAAATGQPVSEVLVCAFAIHELIYGCAETSASGGYTIIGLTGGQFEVEFYPEGNGQNLLYQTYSLGLVTLTAHEETSGVNQALQAGGQILGVVRLAATGSPLRGVRVCLTEAQTVERFVCLTSPASGAFRFYGLPSGSYKVAFSAAAGEVPDEEAIVDSYPSQWWNRASSFATATPIAITAGGVVDGIEGALGPPPPAVVTPPTALPTLPATKPVPKKQPRLRCRHGFTKRKVHGKAKCVRRQKPAKHKRHHKKSA